MSLSTPGVPTSPVRARRPTAGRPAARRPVLLTRSARQAAVAALFIVVSGCGSDSPFDYVPVRGKVVYEDGSPVPGGEVRFISEAPPQGTAHPRPALARLSSDGTFDVVTSYKYGDGLIPGKHKVVILNQSGQPLVPPDYANAATSPLVIDTADAPLHIKVPRP